MTVLHAVALGVNAVAFFWLLFKAYCHWTDYDQYHRGYKLALIAFSFAVMVAISVEARYSETADLWAADLARVAAGGFVIFTLYRLHGKPIGK